MTDNQSIRLITIYFIISDLYEGILKYHCQRFSNNSVFEFTDIELITIYLYSMIEEERFSIKQIHKFAQRYLNSWFPKIPSYVAFNTRLNNLASVFEILVDILTKMRCPDNCNFEFSLLDSLPIITCSGKRTGRVANDLTDKGYCSTKNLYYFGLKLHVLAFQRKGAIPFPESFVITQASENDLNVFKQYWSNISNRTFWGDKIYNDKNFFENLFQQNNSIMLTPIKAIKGQCDELKKRDKAFNDLFSTAVSKVRQPIESLFNWLIQKTDIQRASKVRSSKGLIVHIFGRISAALLCF
jgi:hypothetical protein